MALEWGRRILEEFRLQARLEANTGLPRTTVASGDLETTTKGQHFFAVKVSAELVLVCGETWFSFLFFAVYSKDSALV